MKHLSSAVSRLLFIVAFLLAGLGVIEKLANLIGRTVLRDFYDPWRLVEFAAVVLLFVIALQLREMRLVLGTKSSG